MAEFTFARGIKFPFQRVGNQLPAPTTNDTTVSEALRTLILTPRGSRIMRPDMGTNLWAYIFENNTQLLAENIRAEIATAVAKYEPRVIVLQIDTQRKETDVIISIHYVVRATQRYTSDSIRIPIG
jgi:phage baseplate assembly protein W